MEEETEGVTTVEDRGCGWGGESWWTSVRSIRGATTAALGASFLVVVAAETGGEGVASCNIYTLASLPPAPAAELLTMGVNICCGLEGGT